MFGQADLIAFRHHVYSKEKADVHLYEVGPRFDLRLYQIKLGTIDQVRFYECSYIYIYNIYIDVSIDIYRYARLGQGSTCGSTRSS